MKAKKNRNLLSRHASLSAPKKNRNLLSRHAAKPSLRILSPSSLVAES